MPRDLAIGNGSLLVNFDSNYQIRDIFFPRVGLYNHAGGNPFRFGVWVDGDFAWIDDAGWTRHLKYAKRTLVTEVRLVQAALGLELECADAVDFDRPIYLRRILVRNLRERVREVRLFFHFDFHLFRDGIGDTAYFDPWTHGLVHYKRDVHFLSSALAGDQVGFEGFSTGTKQLHGLEGTWKDAEDGHLQRNPIAQGFVDSTGSVTLHVDAGGEAIAHQWTVAADDFFHAKEHHDLVVSRGPDSFIERTRHFWDYWVTRDDTDLTRCAPEIRDLYQRSMLVLRTQIADNGAIVAANDSDILQFGRDTYSYVWPRDGALVAAALVGASHREIAGRFFRFCQDVLQPGGFMLHKYNPDGTPGSSWHPWANADGDRILPIQEDETALVLYALGKYRDRFEDAEFIRPLYARLIKRSAEFMVEFRHLPTGLPAPSWDLWEERHGIHAFTVASVWAGLTAAAQFAQGFGERAIAQRYETAAAEIRAAADEHLFDEKLGRFVRRLEVRSDGSLEADLTLDVSMYGLWRFGMIAADDPRMVATMEALRERLWVQTDIGGMARYENDYYHQVSTDLDKVPGNPWFICSLWLAQWYISTATTTTDLSAAHDLLMWVVEHALPSGTLAEQVQPYSGDPLSVSPLTWSHAEFALTVQEYVARARAIGD